MTMQVKTVSSIIRSNALHVSIFAMLTCFLTACGSASTPLTYYLLHATNDVSFESRNVKLTIALDKVTLPEYLKHRGLVYQTSDTNLHISTRHLWAEPVDEGLTKALTSALVSNDIALTHPDHYNSKSAETIHMSLHITDLVSTYKGEVIFSGQYLITRTSEETSTHSFVFKSPLNDDGFSSSIKAMRLAIEKLAKDINTTVYQPK